VTGLACSKDGCSLAVGLQDGTTCVFDTYLLMERCYLDRHKKAVTCLEFFEGRVVSGGEDGSVMLHDAESGKCLMRRVNIFKAPMPYSIVQLLVSDVGLAVAIDSEATVKVYDLWRGEKVCKLVPLTGQLAANATKKWVIHPAVVSSGSEL
jgi:WD40 repeat protein